MNVPTALVESAVHIANEISADAILILTNSGKSCELVYEKLKAEQSTKQPKIVAATANDETCQLLQSMSNIKVLRLTAYPKNGTSQIMHAVARGLNKKIFSPGDRLVCLTGNGLADNADTLVVREVLGSEKSFEIMESDPVVVSTVELAMEFGHCGAGEQPIGAAFIIGDTKSVMRRSHQLMLNPFKAHLISITERENWEILKRFARFDGAFIISNDGRIVAAARYLDATAKIKFPLGLGTRHRAVAAMTAVTQAIGVTVSGEDGNIRIFKQGKLLTRIHPRSKILEHVYNLG